VPTARQLNGAFDKRVCGWHYKLLAAKAWMPYSRTNEQLALIRWDDIMARMNGLIVVTGLPGAGKSTVSSVRIAGMRGRVRAAGHPWPGELLDQPLDYFGDALDWLAAQPQVRADAIAVKGSSRGGELSLLLGATGLVTRLATLATIFRRGMASDQSHGGPLATVVEPDLAPVESGNPRLPSA
jgi:BAAT / Acyl-CoA thioester hydrolase C terminal